MHIVRNWMRSPAIVASETMRLAEAQQVMSERHIRRLPVVDSTGKLSGIITQSDINRVCGWPPSAPQSSGQEGRLNDLVVRDIMTRAVVTVTPDTAIMDVARLMLKHRISGVPVLEAGHVTGMLTESDLFRLIVTHEKDDAKHSASLFIR